MQSVEVPPKIQKYKNMCQNHKSKNNKCHKLAKESIETVRTELYFASKMAIQQVDQIAELKEQVRFLESELDKEKQNVSIWQKVVFHLNYLSSKPTK